MSPSQPVVIVTGVGRRGQVGEAIARAFAQRDAKLAVVDRLRDEAEARAAELRGGGGEIRGFGCDLTNEGEVARLAGDVQAAYGSRVDALINVAGGFAMSGMVAESDVGGWHQQFAINLTTAYLATRAFLPALREAKGSIVYFASAAALPGAKVARMAAYAAAKGGVITLMRAVAEEERGSGVRANAVAPTMIRTATNVAEMGEKPRYVEREDVASAVVWLCSDGAKAITGEVIQLG